MQIKMSSEEILNEILQCIDKNNRSDLANSESFKNNLTEIINNPESNYNSQTHLFKEIPDLKSQKTTLESKIKDLSNNKNDLTTEINATKGSISGLKQEIVSLEAQKSNLENIIYGNEESQNDNEKIGLEKYKSNLTQEKDKLEQTIDTLFKIKNDLQRKISDLGKRNNIVEKLSDLKKESESNKKWYYGFTAGAIILLSLITYFAYCYGAGIMSDFQKIPQSESRDYFGVFLIKFPFSLIIISVISGVFIFINKLLLVIEKINNQLRSISQISVIATQIDKSVRESLLTGQDQESTTAEDQKLFYKLIADYLVKLSKNELDFQENKNLNLKELKKISDIISKNSFNNNE